MERMEPTTEMLVQDALRQSRKKSRNPEREELHATAESLHEARLEEEEVVREMVQQWTNGGHGYVPAEKPDDIIRFSVENANSLGIFNKEN